MIPNGSNDNETVLTGVVTALVSFPFLLVLFISFGLVSIHGDGLGYVFSGSISIGILVTILSKKDKTIALAIPLLLVCMLGVLVMQVIFASKR